MWRTRGRCAGRERRPAAAQCASAPAAFPRGTSRFNCARVGTLWHCSADQEFTGGVIRWVLAQLNGSGDRNSSRIEPGFCLTVPHRRAEAAAPRHRRQSRRQTFLAEFKHKFNRVDQEQGPETQVGANRLCPPGVAPPAAPTAHYDVSVSARRPRCALVSTAASPGPPGPRSRQCQCCRVCHRV